MIGSRRIEELEERFGAFEYRINRIEKDMKGLYLFINSYIERIEEDERALSEVKPMLKEVSATLRQIAKGFA